MAPSPKRDSLGVRPVETKRNRDTKTARKSRASRTPSPPTKQQSSRARSLAARPRLTRVSEENTPFCILKEGERGHTFSRFGETVALPLPVYEELLSNALNPESHWSLSTMSARAARDPGQEPSFVLDDDHLAANPNAPLSREQKHALRTAEAAISRYSEVMLNILLSALNLPGIDIETVPWSPNQKRVLVAELWYYHGNETTFPPRLMPLMLDLQSLQRTSCLSAHLEHARVFLHKYGRDSIPLPKDVKHYHPATHSQHLTLANLIDAYADFVRIGGFPPPAPKNHPVSTLAYYLRSTASSIDNTSYGYPLHAAAMGDIALFQAYAYEYPQHSFVARLHSIHLPHRLAEIAKRARK